MNKSKQYVDSMNDEVNEFNDLKYFSNFCGFMFFKSLNFILMHGIDIFLFLFSKEKMFPE